MPGYCTDLFKDLKQFYFWTSDDLKDSCDSIDTEKATSDQCATINEHVFSQYHEAQNQVLVQIQDFTHAVIQRQSEKSEKVKQLVDKETQEGSGTGSAESEALVKDACTFGLANQDDPNDKTLQNICDYTNTKMTLKQKREGLLTFFNQGLDQFTQCEATEACKNSMPAEMKEAGSKIKSFIQQLTDSGKAKEAKKDEPKKPEAAKEEGRKEETGAKGAPAEGA